MFKPHQPHRRLLLSLTALAALAVGGAAQAQTITEIGDAGSTLATAQNTNNQALTSIGGNLGTAGDADFYVINIASPATFSATTVGGSILDTQIYLFTANGTPLFLNDDAPNGASLQSLLPAGSALGPLTAGTYVLGISLSGVDAVNAAAQQLFANPVFSTDIVGPNPSATGTVTGVVNNSNPTESGAYTIAVTGVPEPGTVTMLAIAGVTGLVALRRRTARK